MTSSVNTPPAFDGLITAEYRLPGHDRWQALARNGFEPLLHAFAHPAAGERSDNQPIHLQRTECLYDRRTDSRKVAEDEYVRRRVEVRHVEFR